MNNLKVKRIIFFIAIVIVSLFLFKIISSSNIKFMEETLTFDKKNNLAQSTHEIYTTQQNDFHVELICNLKEGKVQWELIDPKKFTKYEGYFEKRDNILYKKIYYPKDLEEANKEVSSNNKEIKEFLPIAYRTNDGSRVIHSGNYILKIRSIEGEGSITVRWSNNIDKKQFKEFIKKANIKYY